MRHVESRSTKCSRILKAKTWETQIKSVEYPNEIYLSWIFFPHPAHSWGPPDVFWGSALTDIVMMLKRREERAACITSFLFSRENNVPNGLRICFSTTFCNHSSKGQKLLVYHVFTRFWLQFPLKTTQIDLSHSINILSIQIDIKSFENFSSDFQSLWVVYCCWVYSRESSLLYFGV